MHCSGRQPAPPGAVVLQQQHCRPLQQEIAPGLAGFHALSDLQNLSHASQLYVQPAVPDALPAHVADAWRPSGDTDTSFQSGSKSPAPSADCDTVGISCSNPRSVGAVAGPKLSQRFSKDPPVVDWRHVPTCWVTGLPRPVQSVDEVYCVNLTPDESHEFIIALPPAIIPMHKPMGSLAGLAPDEHLVSS